jgi:hypothetical protein
MNRIKRRFLQLLLIVLLASISCITRAQAILNANGPGNTYELITAVLSPGNGVSAVEAPDLSHALFGRHIAEIMDADLNKFVFEFYSHVTPDDDPSTGLSDRQRVEIKTYESSPDSLKGTTGETITYKWNFKIPVGYQPSSSFTHLHQIKPVDGDDGSPLFTLTARKGSPNKLELTYVKDSLSGSLKPAIADLSLFEGIWVQATETIVVGAAGKYTINIKKISDGTVLLSYANSNIATIRPGNSFIRPKWGIYRSLTTPADLRDEAVRFSDFSIKEGGTFLTANTYFWVGGTAITSFTSNSNWNTQLDGSGNSRSLAGALPDDILVIDGSNVGGNIPTTGSINVTISSNSFAQLKLQNNASVNMLRPIGGGGTGTITLGGDATPDPDFVVLAGSNLMINSPLTDGNVIIALSSGVTGLIGGTITLSNTGTHRITSQTTGGLVFASGSTFNADGTPATAAYPFGSNSQGVQNGVVFQAGANLVITGLRSPMGGTSTFQSCNMLTGSNTYFRSNASSATGSWANLKTYGNVFVQNNAVFTADGPFYKIDTLTIDNGCTLTTHTSGHTPVLGNLTVNGTLSSPGGTNTLVMGADIPQAISGTGTINVANFVAANYSSVSLLKNLVVTSSCNLYGNFNFNSGQISGAASFSSKVYSSTTPPTVSFSGTTASGSYIITGVTAPGGITGYRVSGTGIPANTNATGFGSSAGQIYLSKAATVSGTANFTFTYDTATLATAHPNGMDSLTGSMILSGTKSFQSGTNYIINSPTNWPFGISSSAPNYLTLGKVIINANTTTNKNITIKGGLFVNAGSFNIRPVDTVNVTAFNFRNRKLFLHQIRGCIFSSWVGEANMEYLAQNNQVAKNTCSALAEPFASTLKKKAAVVPGSTACSRPAIIKPQQQAIRFNSISTGRVMNINWKNSR